MDEFFIYLKNAAKRTFADTLNLSCGNKKEVKEDSKDLVLADEVLYESVVQGKGPKLRYKFRGSKDRGDTSCHKKG